MSQTQISSRISWIDTCKAYAMILVFYSHLWFTDKIPNSEIFLQNKLIYAFHMPLFFILSGLLNKGNTREFIVFIKNKIFTRITPFLVFNFLLLVCLIPKDILIHKFSVEKYLSMVAGLISGQGSISVITWFLICLLTTELIHFCISSKINSYKSKIIAFVAFYSIGTLVTLNIDTVSNFTGIKPNFWYIHEALVAYPFFMIGVILNQTKLFDFISKSPVKYFSLVLSLIVLLTTFNLNKGFNDQDFSMVLMVNSQHGHPIWFLVTALAGAFSLIFLSQITPTNSLLLFLGKNTLVLLGLNGFFRDILNPMIVRAIPPEALNGNLKIFLVCSLITISSLIACIPGILFFNRFFPQLIGKKKKSSQIPRFVSEDVS